MLNYAIVWHYFTRIIINLGLSLEQASAGTVLMHIQISAEETGICVSAWIAMIGIESELGSGSEVCCAISQGREEPLCEMLVLLMAAHGGLSHGAGDGSWRRLLGESQAAPQSAHNCSINSSPPSYTV